MNMCWNKPLLSPSEDCRFLMASISQSLNHFQQTASSCGSANDQPKRCRECLSEHTTNNNLYWVSSSPLVCFCLEMSVHPSLHFPSLAAAPPAAELRHENTSSGFSYLFLMPIYQFFITFWESNDWVSHLLIFWKGEYWAIGVCK